VEDGGEDNQQRSLEGEKMRLGATLPVRLPLAPERACRHQCLHLFDWMLLLLSISSSYMLMKGRLCMRGKSKKSRSFMWPLDLDRYHSYPELAPSMGRF
jgi:hypothetical protein